MHQRPLSSLLIAVMALGLVGCGGQSAGATVSPVSGGPTSTVTIVPVRTPGTPVPGAADPCSPDQVLTALRPLIPYSEFALSHNIIDEIHNLNVWFVDPGLDPLAVEDEIPEIVAMASRHAALLSHLIVQGNPCVATAFQGITVIVVDRDYNKWFEGQIVSADLPASPNPTDTEIEQSMQAFTQGYARSRRTASVGRPGPSDGSCTWAETRANLASHFDPSRGNVVFSIAVDDDGVNVWAQWDGPPEWESFLTGLLSVDRELSCLYPPLDYLWAIYVDETGLAQLIAVGSGDAVRAPDPTVLVDSLQIVYPPGDSSGG
jgi:hypothetical protein